MEILIKPLEGIFFNDEKILLNEKVDEIKKRFDSYEESKKSKWSNEKIWLREYEICLEIDNDEVISIMLHGGYNSKHKVICYDINIFENKADIVLDLLNKQYSGNILEEDGYSYIYYDTSLSVYREFLPDEYEDEEEFIKEWSSDTCSKEEAKVIYDEDSKKAFYWNSILIGIKDYYKNIL
ncbi:MAG: hypothetical protein R3Y05_00770 [bacterium]